MFRGATLREIESLLLTMGEALDQSAATTSSSLHTDPLRARQAGLAAVVRGKMTDTAAKYLEGVVRDPTQRILLREVRC